MNIGRNWPCEKIGQHVGCFHIIEFYIAIQCMVAEEVVPDVNVFCSRMVGGGIGKVQCSFVVAVDCALNVSIENFFVKATIPNGLLSGRCYGHLFGLCGR